MEPHDGKYHKRWQIFIFACTSPLRTVHPSLHIFQRLIEPFCAGGLYHFYLQRGETRDLINFSTWTATVPETLLWCNNASIQWNDIPPRHALTNNAISETFSCWDKQKAGCIAHVYLAETAPVLRLPFRAGRVRVKEGQNAAVLFVYIGKKVRMRRIVGLEVPLILWIWSVYVKLSAGARKYMNVCVCICVCSMILLCVSMWLFIYSTSTLY